MSKTPPSGVLFFPSATIIVVVAGSVICHPNLSSMCFTMILMPDPVSIIALQMTPSMMQSANADVVLWLFCCMLDASTSWKVTYGFISLTPVATVDRIASEASINCLKVILAVLLKRSSTGLYSYSTFLFLLSFFSVS